MSAIGPLIRFQLAVLNAFLTFNVNTHSDIHHRRVGALKTILDLRQVIVASDNE